MGIVKEILKKQSRDGDQVSTREIGLRCRRSHTTIRDYMKRIKESGLSEEALLKMSEAELTAALFDKKEVPQTRPLPDFSEIHKELSQKGVTLLLLWDEYRQVHPDGYGRTQFYHHYKQWLSKVEPEFRQIYRLGEKTQVDFAGQTIPMVSPEAKQVVDLQVFVMVLCCSNYTYAEACYDQSLKSWINGHVNGFNFFGGVTEVLVPDNLKSGITRACFYEPTVNQTYERFAEHYGSCIIPARKKKPKDKAKAENGVLQVERWVLAPLRKMTFHSIDEVNQAIREQLHALNTRYSKVLGESRKSYFEKLEQPSLKPLPRNHYRMTIWQRTRVPGNYHVEYGGSLYSVPYRLIKQKVWIVATDKTIEVVYQEKRVASHRRSYQKRSWTTLPEHMPENHREVRGWTADSMIQKARQIGANTEQFVRAVMENCKHPEQGIRKCLGIFNLHKRYGSQRLENATKRALFYQALSYKQVRSILEKGLDQNASAPPPPCDPIEHENIRGPAYYTDSSTRH